MRKPRPCLVLLVAVPVMAACTRTQVRPLPTPETRHALDVRGVVVRSGEPARVEFARIDHIAWTDSTLELTGVLRTPAGNDAATTQTFALAALSGVLVREVDADRTSIIIAVLGIGTAVIAALLLSGETSEGTVPSLRGN